MPVFSKVDMGAKVSVVPKSLPGLPTKLSKTDEVLAGASGAILMYWASSRQRFNGKEKLLARYFMLLVLCATFSLACLLSKHETELSCGAWEETDLL